jgi:hypothetical protein
MTFDPFVKGLGTQPILGAMDSMAVPQGRVLASVLLHHAYSACAHLRLNTWLPLSLLNPLREMSLFKIRGGSIVSASTPLGCVGQRAQGSTASPIRATIVLARLLR